MVLRGSSTVIPARATQATTTKASSREKAFKGKRMAASNPKAPSGKKRKKRRRRRTNKKTKPNAAEVKPNSARPASSPTCSVSLSPERPAPDPTHGSIQISRNGNSQTRREAKLRSACPLIPPAGIILIPASENPFADQDHRRSRSRGDSEEPPEVANEKPPSRVDTKIQDDVTYHRPASGEAPKKVTAETATFSSITREMTSPIGIHLQRLQFGKKR